MVIDRHVARVLAHADRDPETGCLVSRYSVGSHGYAQAWNGETTTLAHLLVWRGLVGPIAPGMTIDHVDCHNRKCIEITHLREISNYENARKNRPGADPRLGRCVNGHPDNLVARKRKGGVKIMCLDCERDRNRRYRAGKAA